MKRETEINTDRTRERERIWNERKMNVTTIEERLYF